jgi:hypothetical protein
MLVTSPEDNEITHKLHRMKIDMRSEQAGGLGHEVEKKWKEAVVARLKELSQ